ncbi:hypothetical protein [Metabacillus niabensis]|uniref:hypothetical protein n=1 Tax=Metabacillus niabensis TaxID=324854 RepID=UPI00367346D9
MLEQALEVLNPEAKMILTKIRLLSTRKLLKTGILFKECPERGTVSIMPLSRTSLASLRQNSFISRDFVSIEHFIQELYDYIYYYINIKEKIK